MARGSDNIPNKDLYGILEVRQDAPLSEIKQAYRRLARQYHPGVLGGTGTLEGVKYGSCLREALVEWFFTHHADEELDHGTLYRHLK